MFIFVLGGGEYERHVYTCIILVLISFLLAILLPADKFLFAPHIKFRRKKLGDKFRTKRYHGTPAILKL